MSKEPREFWLNLTTKNPYGSANAYTCWDKSLDTTGGEAIHLREVLPDDQFTKSSEIEELRKDINIELKPKNDEELMHINKTLTAKVKRYEEALIVIASKHKPRHETEEYWNKIPHEQCATVLATDTKISRAALNQGEGK